MLDYCYVGVEVGVVDEEGIVLYCDWGGMVYEVY